MIHKLLFIGIPALIVLAILAVGGWLAWRRLRPGKLKTDYFDAKWHELQKLLPDKAQWGTAIFDADKLLDEALKKKRFRGRSMGERMVAAQRLFTDNDGVWSGHKLRKELDVKPETKLKKADVMQTLKAIRQALKDLGALPS